MEGADLFPMTNMNWSIFIGNPVNRVLSPIFTLQKRMVLVYGVVILFSLTVSLLISRRYTQQIISLHAAAVAVADGDFAQHVEASVKDELGDLTASFNIMTSHLKASYESLEQEIETRKRAELDAECALKEAEGARQKAEAARRDAESANRAKSDFLANMSHELRTPLNAIIGFSQLMERDQESTESQRETVRIIMRSGMHLLTLINDILEMSKIEAGKIEIIYENFDFFQMIQDIITMIKSRAQANGLKLTVDIDPAIPRYIKADQQKLRQVLINLLINAVKFTEQGGVLLRVRCKGCTLGEAMPHRGGLFFEIEDSGIGICKEDIKNLFRKFMRIRSDLNSNEGTGLGLSISQEYARLMGGEITVESEVGKGSVFRFSIEAEIAAEIPLENMDNPMHLKVIRIQPGESSRRVLIVEDNVDNQILLSKLLLSVGFEVRIAADGLEGVKIYESWRPHLIWMDMRMPVMDGYESCRRIRQIEESRVAEEQRRGKNKPMEENSLRGENSLVDQNNLIGEYDLMDQNNIADKDHPIEKRTQGVTIIALTASAFEEHKDLVFAAGCDDFIRKPFLENEIFDAISRHLGVKYLYESSDQTISDADICTLHDYTMQLPSEELTKSSSETLPREFIADMKRAVVDLDLDRIDHLTDEISTQYPYTARRISTLASDFRYREIVEVLNRSGE